jgi:4-alpha-glucanotransferase
MPNDVVKSHAVKVSPLFLTRRAGVLLHPTSLPNQRSFFQEKPYPQMHGALGKDAYDFVDFLAKSGLSIWQMLPTSPTHTDLSPYQSVSAHAGNPELISIDWLAHHGWVDANPAWSDLEPSKNILQAIRMECADQFYQRLPHIDGLLNRLSQFCEENSYWLDDFVLFMALRKYFEQRSWNDWPAALKKRDPQALSEFREFLAPDISLYVFEQFAFAEQWKGLRDYAKEKQIYLFGDMPIFVAHDSSDVWAAQEFFNLAEDGTPLTVAGVPPDYFSETGQHWGNPHYNWDSMEKAGFSWWIDRLRTQLNQFDLIRIDHFRGFEAFWEIPCDSVDARGGQWVKAPGEAFLSACFKAFPGLPVVAENLGVITPEVEALRNAFHLPGMLVLQFAFDGNNKNPHLPHCHSVSDVIYTGTHDNDTTVGWFESLNDEQKSHVTNYLYASEQPIHWLLIESALASVAPLTMIPLQDFLALDGKHRMNMPGTTGINWRWQFNWNQFPIDLENQIHARLYRYDRLN